MNESSFEDLHFKKAPCEMTIPSDEGKKKKKSSNNEILSELKNIKNQIAKLKLRDKLTDDIINQLSTRVSEVEIENKKLKDYLQSKYNEDFYQDGIKDLDERVTLLEYQKIKLNRLYMEVTEKSYKIEETDLLPVLVPENIEAIKFFRKHPNVFDMITKLHLNRITTLDFQGLGLGDQLVENLLQIKKSCLKKLKGLNLHGNNLTYKSLEHFSKKIKLNLTWLDLSNNLLEDDAIIYLSKVTCFEQLNLLDLRGNKITNISLSILSNCENMTSLKKLDISENPISIDCIQTCPNLATKISLKNKLNTIKNYSIYQIFSFAGKTFYSELKKVKRKKICEISNVLKRDDYLSREVSTFIEKELNFVDRTKSVLDFSKIDTYSVSSGSSVWSFTSHIIRGNILLFVGLESGIIEVWNILSGEKVNELNGTNSILSMCIIKNRLGNFLFTCNESIMVWDLNTFQLVRRLSEHSKTIVDIISVKLEGVTYLISASDDKSMIIWNLIDFHSFKVIKQDQGIYSLTKIASNHENDFLYSGAGDKPFEIKKWDMQHFLPVESTISHTDSVRYMTSFFINDFPFIASAGSDNNVCVFNASKLHNLFKFTDHTRKLWCITSLKKSNGDVYLASCGSDSRIIIWDMNKKENNRLVTLNNHRDHVFSVYTLRVMGYDFLVSGGKDSEFFLWKVG